MRRHWVTGVRCWVMVITMLLGAGNNAFCQHPSPNTTNPISHPFTFVELNCENLFDTEHDSLKQDQEWLDDSPRHWTRKRYWQKLNNIAQEIIACGESSNGWRLPDLVALCEIENDSVMKDLARRSLLRKSHYQYVMTESPDLRGIDVALLYSPSSFRLTESRSLRVEPLEGMRPTRDILYAKGLIISGDTLHVFVVHAPSRYGGEHATRPHRLQVATTLATNIDSIISISPEAPIIVAGDFNDYHDNASPQLLYEHGLTNLTRDAKGSNGAEGTYKFLGEWRSIDHVMATRTMAEKMYETYIADHDFLMEEDEKYGGKMPLRSYQGYKYKAGFSDHLPLVVRFNLEVSE